MRVLMVLAILAAASPVTAAVYKCPAPGGGVAFSDRPCGGSASSPENEVKIKAPPVTNSPTAVSEEERDRQWEEQREFRYVTIPATERQAAELMASPDPAAQALGRKLAMEAQNGREAFAELERVRKSREEIEKRYSEADKIFRGY